MKQVRCSEAECIDLGFAGYQGTPQSLAQRMVAEAGSYNWLSLDVAYHDEPPLSSDEAVELLYLIRELGDQSEKDFQTVLPELPTLLEPRSFDQLVLKERELTARLLSVSAESRPVLEVLSRIPQAVRTGFESAIRDYLEGFDALAVETEPWVKGTLHDVAVGRHRSWSTLAAMTETKSGSIACKVQRAAEARISGLEGRDRTQVRADAECLHAHLASGKGIGIGVRYNPFTSKHVKGSLYVADTFRVNGRPCDQQAVVGDLIDYLDVIGAIEYIDQQWSSYVQPQTIPLLLAFEEHMRRAQLLRRVLGLRTNIDATALLAKSIPDLPPIAFHERQSVATLISLLAAAVVQEELRGIQQEVVLLQSHLGALRREPRAHDLISELFAAVEARDLDWYSRAHSQVVAAWALRARLQRRRALERQLSRPDLVAQVVSGRHDTCWNERLLQFESAWNWARANGWLKEHADPHRESSLLQKIDLSQQRIRKDLRELAASKAWQYVLARLRPEQREHLMAWKLAIKKIGKGTGKYAIQYRKEARYHLDHCRGAIPAWVMPIFRVAETTKPAPDQFDVAIIDEASQSGPEALFLQYIARKIVVVGDDQQISPESVGLDRGAVDSLRQRYIKDLPHWDALGVDNSFFDQAQIRFAGRIRLREHFRCMPEIIQFSNNLCYQAEPLVPLRQYGTERVVPVVTRHVADGYAKGTGDRVVNRPEAEAIVEQIVKCLADPAYEGKSFGVIGLQGNAQSNLIRDLLIDRIGAQRMQQRGIVCGNAYAFQGDERDVIFLSMVAAVNDDRHIGVLSKESDKRRFNVAASRARDQMWLFHSVNADDLSSFCLRRQLLEYCLNPRVRPDTVEGINISNLQRQAIEASRGDSRPPVPFDSWFEVDVFLQTANRGFRVIPQYELAGKRI
ncbi:MAG: AAA domain-containing protein, partial [Acidobacteria bacterium]|nr:AAA domain-containing protein [Acidobacteriota bacterium]